MKEQILILSSGPRISSWLSSSTRTPAHGSDAKSTEHRVAISLNFRGSSSQMSPTHAQKRWMVGHRSSRHFASVPSSLVILDLVHVCESHGVPRACGSDPGQATSDTKLGERCCRTPTTFSRTYCAGVQTDGNEGLSRYEAKLIRVGAIITEAPTT